MNAIPMNCYELTVGERTLKLRLSVGQMAQLEKMLGENPLMLLTKDEPLTFEEITAYFYAALREQEQGYTMEKVYALLDELLAQGRGFMDWNEIIGGVLEAGGYLNSKSAQDEDSEKNAQAQDETSQAKV